MQRIKVFAPATVANVAVGFDILGFALDAPGDEIELMKTDKPHIEIEDRTGIGLPLDPAKNTAGIALMEYLKHIGSEQGFKIIFHKKINPGSGIGSSAASSAASVFAANKLMGEPLTTTQLVEFAMQGERAASGTPHADNVAPALLGGFVLIRSYSPLDIVQVDYPRELHCAVVHPDIEVRTEDARKILKRDIPLKSAIKQWGNTAGLIAGLFKGDYALIGRSLNDIIIEPIRALLIPEFAQVKQTALDAGAIGASISGSGPSLFALTDSMEKAQKIGLAMQQKFAEIGLDSQVYASPVNAVGPRILSSE